MGIILSPITDTFKSLKSALAYISALNADFNAALARAALSPGLPNPNPSQSYWLNDPPFPALVDVQSPQLPETADVVVIGSGIAGAAITRSLLHELRRRDASPLPSIVVLEARDICSGATGRNGGHIKASPYDSFTRLSKTFPKERAAALARFQIRHVDCLVELCQAEGIDAAEAREVETADLFLDRETYDEAVEDVEECRKWLPEVETTLWEGEALRERFGVNESVVGAISQPAGAIWPYRFVTSIWKRLLDDFPDSLTIETNTPVKAITTSNRPAFPYAVETSSRGLIHARHVVHATNAHAGHLVPGLRSKITGAKAHMSAQKPGDLFPATATSAGGDRSWGVIYGGAFDYVTQRPSSSDAAAGDLMLGGGFTRSLKQGIDQIGYYDDGEHPDALTTTHIMGVFPAIFRPNWGPGGDVKQLWTGIIGMTGDLVPLVGRLDTSLAGRKMKPSTDQAVSSNKDGDANTVHQALSAPGEWIAAGFSGEGMVWAWLCGTALGIMIAGGSGREEEEDVPASPGRPGGKLADWFPTELLISKERLKSAHVSNLAEQL